MRSEKFRKLIILLIALSFIRVIPCQARATFIPNVLLNLQLNYDSNFYYRSSDEISVVTRLVEPGFEFGLETAKALLAAYYTLSANYYNHAGEKDFYGHKALLVGEYELSSRTKIDLKDTFVYTQDPAQLDTLSLPSIREKYTQNRFRASLTYDFEPKFTGKLEYQNWITDYENDFLEDAIGNQFSIDLVYHLNRSSALDVKYQYWNMDYDGTTPDYISRLLWLKYRKEWQFMAMEAGVGIHKRAYDDPGPEDTTTMTYSLVIEGASRSGKSRYSLTGQQDYNYLGFHRNDYYRAYRFTGKFDYDWTPRITTGLEALYQNNDYIFFQRTDDIRKIGAEVSYDIKEWLDLVCSVTYENRKTDTGFGGYDRLISLVELQFDYDIGRR